MSIDNTKKQCSYSGNADTGAAASQASLSEVKPNYTRNGAHIEHHFLVPSKLMIMMSHRQCSLRVIP